MSVPEIFNVVSGTASFIGIVAFAWRAIARFTRMEDQLKVIARQQRIMDRRMDRLERSRGGQR